MTGPAGSHQRPIPEFQPKLPGARQEIVVVAIVAAVMVTTFTVALRPLTVSAVRPFVTAVATIAD